MYNNNMTLKEWKYHFDTIKKALEANLITRERAIEMAKELEEIAIQKMAHWEDTVETIH